MIQITEDYVSFETAKLLKEKGFDKSWADGSIEKYLKGTEGYSLPTIALVLKWLREVYNIHISVYPFNKELPITENTSYTCDVTTKKDSPMRGHLRGTWKTYEETCEKAIKYCLEHLI